MGSVRSGFVREVLALVERERGTGAVAFVCGALPERVRSTCSKESLAKAGPTATVPLADVEDFLNAIDTKLGDGSGRFLEELATEFVARTLSQSGGSVIVGDLHGTLARLRVPFQHPFLNMTIKYALSRTPSGLSLEVGAEGHPRMTRIVRHLAVGAVHAAQRFARCQAPQFRVYGETRGETARVDVILHTRSEPPASQSDPSQPPRRSTRPLGTSIKQASLSEEVDAIFSRRSSQVAPTTKRTLSPTGYSVQEPEHGQLDATPSERAPRRPSTPGRARTRSNPRPPESTSATRPRTNPRPPETTSATRPRSNPRPLGETSATRPQSNPRPLREDSGARPRNPLDARGVMDVGGAHDSNAPERTTVRPTVKGAPPSDDEPLASDGTTPSPRRTKPY